MLIFMNLLIKRRSTRQKEKKSQVPSWSKKWEAKRWLWEDSAKNSEKNVLAKLCDGDLMVLGQICESGQ